MDTKSRSNKSLTSSSIPFQPGNNRIYLEEVLDRRIYNSAKHIWHTLVHGQSRLSWKKEENIGAFSSTKLTQFGQK